MKSQNRTVAAVERPFATIALDPSPTLVAQIDHLVNAYNDYIPKADGVDDAQHVVVNFFEEGVWLCAHHDSIHMKSYTRLQRLR